LGAPNRPANTSQNWFQNRRAKAKQEARQKKANSEPTSPGQNPVKEYFPSSDDLRPSSAAFPVLSSPTNLPASGHASPLEESAPGGLEILNQPLESAHQEQSDELSSGYASPEPVAFQTGEHAFAFPVESSFFPVQAACDFRTMVSSSPEMNNHAMHGQLSIVLPADITTSLQGSPDSIPAFASYGNADCLNGSLSTFPSQLLPGGGSPVDMKVEEQLVHDECRELSYEELSPGSLQSTSAVSPDPQLKSPPAVVDLASRRNMPRPAALGTNALRSASYSHSGPKTGIDMPRRSEATSPMRRIASATGLSLPGRITKSVSSTPRSPLYFERKQEAFFQLARTPGNPAQLNAIAPPTPSTPVIGNQQCVRETTVSSTSSEDDKGYTFQTGAFMMDPTLSTPPATPGLISNFPDTMFSNPLEASYNYTVADEPLATPSVAGFEADFPSMQHGIPSYVASQPPTPSFQSTAIGPAYFAIYPGSNPEYNWSDPSSSAKSSPGQQARARQFQFSNSTPQDFSNSQR
jgi:hypothetical protein